MFRARWIEIDIFTLLKARHHLGEARAGSQVGLIFNLRRFIVVHRHIFLAQNFLDAILFIEATEPQLRLVGEMHEAILSLGFPIHLRKAEPHHLGKGVEPDRGSHGIHSSAQDDVARMGAAQRARDAGPCQDEGLARTCAAIHQGRTLLPAEQLVHLALFLGQPKGRGHLRSARS